MSASVPAHVRLLGLLAAAVSVLCVAVPVAAIALLANGVTATGDSVRSFTVGTQPTVEVDAGSGLVEVERGDPGRVDVEQRWSVSSLIRAAAQGAQSEMRGETHQEGERVLVRLSSISLRPWTFSHSSSARIKVPAGSALRIRADSAAIQLRDVAGSVQISDRTGSVKLRETALAGDSEVRTDFGEVSLESVTVSGHTTLSAGAGRTAFRGSLAPGGSALEIHDGRGAVDIALPQPTDARARVSIQAGYFDPDPGWRFQVQSTNGGRTATADLGPEPSGSVSVTLGEGSVRFRVLGASG
jgi:hypothetical protein